MTRSPLELFRRDLAHFEPVFGVDGGRPSTEELRAGRVPALCALSSFNGTVWRWMCPCYGVTDGRPHLRIENRILPAGPTLADEVANAAFWVGLMNAVPDALRDAPPRLDFAAAEENFHAAARSGLDAQLQWLGGERIGARALLLERLLPLARAGLVRANVDPRDVERYLAILTGRVETGQTGARWMLDAFDASALPVAARSWEVTNAIAQLAWGRDPIHRWPVKAPARRRALPVAAAMHTAFVAVQPDTPMVLAAHQVAWAGASEIVVEHASGEMVGVLGEEDVERWRTAPAGEVTVAALLPADGPMVLPPEIGIDEALSRLRAARRSCALVVRGALVAGVVRRRDLEASLRGHHKGAA